MNKKWNLFVVSHTHWDREWYFSLQRFNRRFVKMMDRLLALLEKDENYRYFHMDGQLLVVLDYLAVRPEKRELVKRFVKEGRLLVGPWYSPPTASLCDGEAIIRNFMLGMTESEKLGRSWQVCHIPDGLGHISQIPLICAGFGMTDVVVWRGIHRDAKTVFKWIGGSGDEVFLHHMKGAYGDSVALPTELEDFVEIIDDTPYQRAGLDKRIESFLELRGSIATTNNLLMMNGVDHSFAQGNLAEVIDLLNANFPEITVNHSTMDEYIAAVKDTHESENIAYETFRGELVDPAISPVLKEIHSTAADIKMFNAKIEDLFIKWMEPLATFAWLLGAEYPTAEINQAWELLLQNQTHDTLGCSSITTVYKQAIGRFEAAFELGQDMMEEYLQILCNAVTSERTGKEIPLVVFNPLTVPRDEVMGIVVDVPRSLNFNSIKIMDGEEEIPYVIHDKYETVRKRYNPFWGWPNYIDVDRYTISLNGNIAPLGYKTYTIKEAEVATWFSGNMLTAHNCMENEYLLVTVNTNGTIDLYGKETEHRYRGLHFFEDSGEAGSGFRRLVPQHDQVISSYGNRARLSVKENTALSCVLQIDMQMDLPLQLEGERRSAQLVTCKISSQLKLTKGARRLEIETSVNNQAKDHRLQVKFPTHLPSAVSYAEQPFDVVEREIALPDKNGYHEEKPSGIFGQLRFCGITDGKHGLMVANTGIYEYEVVDTKERCIALTLLRCMEKLEFGGHNEDETERMEHTQCIGKYTFRYALIPHRGGYENAIWEAYKFRYGVKSATYRALEEEVLPDYIPLPKHSLAKNGSLLLTNEDHRIYISAIKKHEGNESVVVRFHNISKETVEHSVGIAFPWIKIKEAYRIDLREQRVEELTIREQKAIFSISGKSLTTVELVIATEEF